MERRQRSGRRRPVMSACGRLRVATVVVVLLALSAACGQSETGSPQVSAEGGDPVDSPTWGRCGEQVPGELGAGSGLVLAASFRSVVPSETEDRFEGTVTVTNRRDVVFSGMAAGEADVYVALAGQIVATPFPQEDRGLLLELPPGGTQTIPATGRLRHCADESKRLEPGGYEVYAVLSLTEGSSGRAELLSAGPSPLQVT